MNRRGFAVSALIYGLAILGFMLITMLMSILSTTRSNSKTMAEDVENELNTYSKTSITYSASDKGQRFTVPDGESGWYRVELWGAGGSNGAGGFGAYTTGIIKLNAGDNLYFYIGKRGSNGVGGGESSLRVISEDTASPAVSQKSRIMVAASGGAGNGSNGSTIKKYRTNIKNSRNIYNSGGTYYLTGGSNLINKDFTSVQTITSNPYNYNQANNSSGAGKGYYNGSNSSEGGTSFISGYAGATAYSRDSNTGSKYTYYEYSYDRGYGAYMNNGRDYYFYDGMMIEGVNSGDGVGKIERVVSETDTVKALPRINKKLDSVRYIRDCAGGASSVTITAVANGVSYSSTQAMNGGCAMYDLGSVMKLDEVSVWHDGGAGGRDYTNHTISVSNGGAYSFIKNVGNSNGYSNASSITETPNGIHISAYQPDYTQDKLPAGNYYIFGVTSNDKVLSAYSSKTDQDEQLRFNPINGGNQEKWSIKPINCKLYENYNSWSTTSKSLCQSDISNVNASEIEYRIEDLIRFNALTIQLDENKVKNALVSNIPFNELTRNAPQIWKIISIGNGTYVIRSSAPAFKSTEYAGGLMYDANTSNDDNANKLIITSSSSINLSRFYFYKLDF